MADNENTPSENGGTTPPATTTPTAAPPQDDKKYADLQKTISEQGASIKELQDAVIAASVISNTITSDPTLKASFDSALRKQYGLPGNEPNQEDKSKGNNPNGGDTTSPTAQIERDVKEVKEADRNKTIIEFEKEAGIDRLPEDKQKEAKAKIERYLNSFGWSVKTIPLTSLRDSLDKAYVGTIGIERAKEEGKVEALTSYRNNEKAVMGSFSGASINGEEEGELTTAQQKWLKNLGVDADKAKKFYKDREGEKTRAKPVK